MKILSKSRLLCFSDKYNLYSQGVWVWCVDKTSGQIVYKDKLPIKNLFFSIFSRITLVRRVLRLEARCGIFVTESRAIISFHGAIYLLDVFEKSIRLEHKYISGMNNPLSFAFINEIDGFSDGHVYGEYTNDGKAKEVAIYRRNMNGMWEKAYVFPSGRVKHIHTIIPSKYRSSVFVFTGDSDAESGIWEFEKDFSSLKSTYAGTQLYRTCVACVMQNDLVYATDMPDSENMLLHIDLEKEENKINTIMNISGPCIYGKQLPNGDMVFSTSVEGESTNSSLFSWISQKLGNGVKDRLSHVYIGNKEKGFRELAAFKKDMLPPKMFGFGNVMFPTGDSNEVFAVGSCLRHISNKTIVLKGNAE